MHDEKRHQINGERPVTPPNVEQGHQQYGPPPPGYQSFNQLSHPMQKKQDTTLR